MTKQNKKNILMVHNYYLIGGGEHTVFEAECKLLEKNGHNVIRYTRDNKELKNIFKKIFLPITSIFSLKTYREVKKIIKENNIDIVHCHNTFPLVSPSVYYAARKSKKPVIQTIHNFRFLCPNGVFFKDGKICEECLKRNDFKQAIKNKCYRNSKLQTQVVINMLRFHRKHNTYKKISYIFLTEFNKRKFCKLINIDSDQVFIKPNFVDGSIKKYRTNIDEKNKTFIYIGRLDETKGIKELLKLWKTVPKEYSLHIYGDGDCKNIVEEATIENKNIKYFGFQKKETIYKDLSKSIGLLFTSLLYEGFPMVITEALGLGKPILCSNIGNGASITSASSAGVLFDVKDTKSFKKAFNDIVQNNEKYSKKAIEYFDKYLNEKSNYKLLEEIYEKARCID